MKRIVAIILALMTAIGHATVPGMAVTGGLLTSPLTISGCVLWLDAADSSTITQSSGVTQWNDKSSNGFNVTNISGKPSYQSAIQNGKNIVRFSGSQAMRNVSATLLRAVSGWTILIVLTTSQNTAAADPVAIQDNTTLTRAVVGSVRVTTGFRAAGGRRVAADSFGNIENSTQATINTFLIATAVGNYTTTTGTLYLNGTQSAQNTSWLSSGNSDNNGGNVFVGSGTTGAVPWSGDIAEIIIYNTALSTSDRARVEAYLKAKWGL